MLHSRLLRYLDEVARAGSIRAASRRLNVASSAINRQILALEAEIGVPIFERLPRRLRLTAAGEVVILHVRETLKSHERMTERVNDLTGRRWGRVIVASIGTVAAEVLPGVVTRFRASHPRSVIDVRLVVDVLAQVEADEVDAGIGFELPSRPGLETLFDIPVPMGAVMAPDHPLAGARSVTLRDCVAFPLILPNESMSTRPMLDAALRAHMDRVLTALESNSVELMKRAAQNREGIAFLTPLNVGTETLAGTLVYVPLADQHLRPLRLKGLCRTQQQVRPMTLPFMSACADEVVAILKRIDGTSTVGGPSRPQKAGA